MHCHHHVSIILISHTLLLYKILTFLSFIVHVQLTFRQYRVCFKHSIAVLTISRKHPRFHVFFNINANKLISLVNLSITVIFFVYISIPQHFSHTLMKDGLSVRNIGNLLYIIEFLQATFLWFFLFTFL